MSTVETVLSLSIPGVPLLLVAVGVWELRRQKKGKQVGTPISATYINEFTAMFYGTKRVELENRDSMSMMREEDSQGAPPWLDLDLDRRTMTVRPDDPDRSQRPVRRVNG